MYRVVELICWGGTQKAHTCQELSLMFLHTCQELSLMFLHTCHKCSSTPVKNFHKCSSTPVKNFFGPLSASPSSPPLLCFVVLNPRVLPANGVDLGFFFVVVSKVFQFYPPPLPPVKTFIGALSAHINKGGPKPEPVVTQFRQFVGELSSLIREVGGGG